MKQRSDDMFVLHRLTVELARQHILFRNLKKQAPRMNQWQLAVYKRLWSKVDGDDLSRKLSDRDLKMAKGILEDLKYKR